MKISRTISVDLDVWKAAVDAGIDRNAVCEKALKDETDRVNRMRELTKPPE